MIAMGGPTPNGDIAAPAFPGELNNTSGAGDVLAAAPAGGFEGIILPDVAPIAAPRPDGAFGEPAVALATMGYAADTSFSRLSAFASMDKASGPWKQLESEDYVLVGSFETADEADALAKKLAAFGRIDIETSDADGKTWRTVNLHADGRHSVDDMLRAAWAEGADGAMTIHD